MALRRTTLTFGPADGRRLARYLEPGAHDAYRGALEEWMDEHDQDPATLTTEAAVIRALLAVADEALTERAFARGYAQLDTWYAAHPEVAAEEQAEREVLRARRGRREALRTREEQTGTDSVPGAAAA
jgi:hypothetical protein